MGQLSKTFPKKTLTSIELSESCSGREFTQVDEPQFSPPTIFIFELEAYPEPKCLSPADLEALFQQLGTNKKVADHINASTNFIRDNRNKKPKGDKNE